MAGRRHTTPLFEIVSRNGSGQPAQAEPKPVQRLAPAEAAPPPREPQPRPAPRQAPEPESRSVPRAMGRLSLSDGWVRLPVNYAYVGLSAVLVLALLAWTLGFMVGGRTADERARQEIESATGGAVPRDPLLADRPAPADPRAPVLQDLGRASGTQPESPRTNTPPINWPSGLPAIGSARTRFLAQDGYFVADPRTAGLNYFCLVSRLTEADTVRALEFLARNGVAAVGVEGETSTSSNRFFALWTLEGLPSEGFRENPVRSAHETRVADLGRRWRTEERGTSDFSRPQWYRYNPSQGR